MFQCVKCLRAFFKRANCFFDVLFGEYTDTAHEIGGHHLAATNEKAYKEVLDATSEWWIAKNGFSSYDEKISSIEKQQSLSYTDAQEEFVSEFIAVLFSTDDGINDFITWLKDKSGYSEQQRKTVLQKFLDLIDKVVETIKSLVKSGNLSDTAKEAMTVEADKAKQMRKIVLDGLNESGKAVAAEFSDANTKFSVKRDKGKEYWQIDSSKDIFKGLKTKEEYQKAAFYFLLGNRDNNVIFQDQDGKEIKFIRLSAEEFTNSEESQKQFSDDSENFKRKMRMIPSLQDVLLHSNVNWHSPDLKNHKLFKQGGFENYRGRVRIDDVIFNSVVRVGSARFGSVFYDINLEVDKIILPHTNSASEINMSTSVDPTVPQTDTGSQDNDMQKSEKDTKKNSL